MMKLHSSYPAVRFVRRIYMQRMIKNHLENAYPHMLETLRELTSIDRESRYIPGLTQTADYIQNRLLKLGCTIERYEDDTYGPTLVGKKQGTGKAVILFYAHMDTVWPKGTAAARPFTVEGDRAYGAGVSDCSHGIVGALYMLESLRAIEFDSYKELILLFNSDEELYSPHSQQYIEQYAKCADVAFCMESSDNKGEYISSRAGVMFYDLEVRGVKSHAGGMPEKGRNAIEELAHKITLIHELKIPNAYIHTTLIGGGINEGMVPDYAWAHVDVRVDTMEAENAVVNAMAHVEKDVYIPDTQTKCVRRPGGCLPMVRVPEQDKLCAVVDAVSKDLGYPLHESFCGGGANAVLSALVGTPTLDGVTPTSGAWHTDHEYLDLDSLVPRISILAETVRRICLDDRFLKG